MTKKWNISSRQIVCTANYIISNHCKSHWMVIHNHNVRGASHLCIISPCRLFWSRYMWYYLPLLNVYILCYIMSGNRRYQQFWFKKNYLISVSTYKDGDLHLKEHLVYRLQFEWKVPLYMKKFYNALILSYEIL